MNTPTNNWRL